MATPGDVLTDFVTAPWYNKVTQKLGLVFGHGDPNILVQNHYCTVYNHSTTAKKIWEPVSLGDAKLDYETDGYNGPLEEIAFVTKDLDANDAHNIAILQEPLQADMDAPAKALLVGVSWVRTLSALPVSGVKRVYIGSSDVLDFTDCGRVEALFQYDLGSEYITLVMIGKLNGVKLRVNGYDFDISHDCGETWDTWATGEECSS